MRKVKNHCSKVSITLSSAVLRTYLRTANKLYSKISNDRHFILPPQYVIRLPKPSKHPVCWWPSLWPLHLYRDWVKTLLTFASGLPQVFETNLCSIWSSRIWCYFVSPSTPWTLEYCRKKAPASYWMPKKTTPIVNKMFSQQTFLGTINDKSSWHLLWW